MKVAVVHYHARPGGVTRVVERAVAALGDRADALFFTGEKPPAATPLESHIRVVPGLGYAAGPGGSDPELAKAVHTAFGGEPDVWHIHNHSLGKNPAFTRAVTELAECGRRLLLQIHDFAEDGRPANYRHLGALRDRLYPIGPHIHYAVLNNRDYRFLLAAGVPEESLHLLANPVPCPPGPAPETDPAMFDADPLILYPCRAIRRKNLGELLLWSARFPRARFAVTLAPRNPEVLPIYEAWTAFAATLNLNVQFDAGTKTPFETLMQQADSLITTSIAEGFGLAFLEPWTFGQPLTGRNLPEITADFTAHGMDLSALYDRLPIPLRTRAWDLQEAFNTALEEQLRAVHSAYRRPWSDSLCDTARTALIRDGLVDFGILNETMQRTVIRAVEQDASLLERELGENHGAIAANRETVRQHYSETDYGDRLFTLYQQVAEAGPEKPGFADSNRLLDEFLQPERFNLLRT